MVTPDHAKSRRISSQPSTSLARRPARRFHFTARRVADLPVPTNGQRAYFYDDEVRGLAVAVSTGGKKTFILYRIVAGRPGRVTICSFGGLSVVPARGEGVQKKDPVAPGGEPAAPPRGGPAPT